MSVYIDRKYLLLISSRLSKFAQKKEDLFNFRCCYCGDSQKNLHKARGYVYRKGNDYFYICHNCNVSTTFAKLLQFIDAERYKEYAFERYANGDNKHSPYQKPNIQEVLTGPKPIEKYKNLDDVRTEGLPSVDMLPDGHYAKEYIRNRRIPENFWNEIFFTKDYKNFLDRFFPNHGKENLPNDARIVLFYTDIDETITNVTGRALAADNDIRYITVKILDRKKIFGLHRSGPEKVYITEGQFDSFFLPNAVASGDANLIGLADFMSKFNYSGITLVFDNQPRNKDIVKQMKFAIDLGYAVTLLPYDPNSKDINEMVRSGMSSEEVKKLIDDNTFQGLTASMNFTKWRKC